MWRERWIKNAAWSLKDMNKQEGAAIARRNIFKIINENEKAANAIAIAVSQKRKTLMK